MKLTSAARNGTNTRTSVWTLGVGQSGKVAVVGDKDCATGNVKAEVVEGTGQKTLQGFIFDNAAPGAAIYTDDHRS